MWKSVEGWRSALKNRVFRDQLLVSVIALPVIVIIMRIYLEHIEIRPGIVFPDPLPSVASPIDFNWVIFAILYSGLLFGLVSLSMYPFRFLLTIRAFVVLILLRMICLFLFPLDSFPGGIPLFDPIVQVPALRFSGLHGLFFCWEGATLALLSMTSRWRDVRTIFAIATVAISALLLLQKAQYAISIVAAPVFAYAAYGMARFATPRDVYESREAGHNGQTAVAVGRSS